MKFEKKIGIWKAGRRQHSKAEKEIHFPTACRIANSIIETLRSVECHGSSKKQQIKAISEFNYL